MVGVHGENEYFSGFPVYIIESLSLYYVCVCLCIHVGKSTFLRQNALLVIMAQVNGISVV